MILSNVLVGIQQEERLVSVSFTALVLNELVMVGLEINTWHRYMIYAEIATFLSYFVSIPFLGDYFGISDQQKPDPRFVIYYHVVVCLEDYSNSVGQFGASLGVEGIAKKDKATELCAVTRIMNIWFNWTGISIESINLACIVTRYPSMPCRKAYIESLPRL